MTQSQTPDSLSYRDAGVDIDAGNALVERIRPTVAKTMRPEVMTGLGGFGALFELPVERYREPVLVSGTDGVGTKVELAARLGRVRGIGHDIVNHCIDDVLVQSARPFFFLDYIAAGELDADLVAEVVTVVREELTAVGEGNVAVIVQN